MLKFTALATATVIATLATASAPAHAIDHGPCDHCTMDPIVVKGERPKKKAKAGKRQLKTVQPAKKVRKLRK